MLAHRSRNDPGKHMKRCTSAFRSAFCLVALCTGAPAWAADPGSSYPSRPIRWLVPTPPGGGTDAISRIMAPKLTDIFKQQIVVDNRGGAQGSIGTALVAKSVADGYTI